LFRDYGEEYIEKYKPSLQQIKLIRAIRICKTPALGGHLITCTDCDHKHYVYNSCGHSHCMLCQSLKREQWVDKLKASMLKVPYVHAIFTLPHQLNGLARNNESEVYSLIMKVSWLTIKAIIAKQGGIPGMTSVLHTFGSKMNYHIHVHSLVTFGGLNKDGLWVYPCKKQTLDSYRSICSMYKTIFLIELDKLYQSGKIVYHQEYSSLIKEVEKLRWVVHTTRPTMDTNIIADYLAKYINRIAVSNKRLDYVKASKIIVLLFNDYKNQEAGKVAPKAYINLEPLVALEQILQHVLPKHFQKSRRHGLHNSNTNIKKAIPDALKNNLATIRTIMEIITHLSNLKPFECDNCKSTNYSIEEIRPNKTWIHKFLNANNLRAPPLKTIIKKSANKIKECRPFDGEAMLYKENIIQVQD
jgi:hypothetical protein